MADRHAARWFAWPRIVEAAMKQKHFSKAEMARRMPTSRSALDRLLDLDYEAVTLSTLRKAATAVRP